MSKWHEQIRAKSETQGFSRFDEIDDAKHEQEIKSLEAERLAIEQNSNSLQVLRARLSEAGYKIALQAERLKVHAGDERELQTQIFSSQKLLNNAEADILRRESEGALADR